jgi:heterodisulfide reductase subunit B
MTDISYFPGCSLATSARENNLSLIEVARHLGYNLVELEDWNCCGSSSTHSIKGDLAFQLAVLLQVLRYISIRGQTGCCHTDGQPDYAGRNRYKSGLHRYRLCDVSAKSGNPLHSP